MELKDLIGKQFKYISPYSKKESEWTGVVKSYLISQVISEFDKNEFKFRPEITIVSEHGSAYKLSELVFLKKNFI